jgi:hypothetical protein
MPVPNLLKKALQSVPARKLMDECRKMVPAGTTADKAVQLLDRYSKELDVRKKASIAKELEQIFQKMQKNKEDADNQQKESEGLILKVLQLLVAMTVASKGANDALAQVSQAYSPSQDLMPYVAKLAPAAAAVTGTVEEVNAIIKKYNGFRNDHVKEFEGVPGAETFNNAEELKNDPRFAQYSDSLNNIRYPATFFSFPNAEMLNQFQQETGIKVQPVMSNAERSQQQGQHYQPNQDYQRSQQNPSNQQQQRQNSAPTPKPENHYDVLNQHLKDFGIKDDKGQPIQISPSCSQQDLNKAYKKLSVAAHPDKAASMLPEDRTPKIEEKITQATNRFKDISQRFSTLRDPHEKEAYDSANNLSSSSAPSMGMGRG